MIEQFEVTGVSDRLIYMSWLGNRIYVVYYGSTTIRVFTDHAPFGELLEAIQIPELGRPVSMTASAVSKSIFISDNVGYIYKIQMPTGKIRRWESRSLDGKFGLTARMSDSTVLDNCLVTTFYNPVCNLESVKFELHLFSQHDGGLNRYSAIPLPKEIKVVGYVVHSPDENFIISYKKTGPATKFWISILSSDGETFIRTFDPNLLGSVLENPTIFPFGVDDNGHMFVADFNDDKVIWLNSNFTDYRIILQKDHAIYSPCNVIYNSEKRQLLVQEKQRNGSVSSPNISIFHLSPCNLIQQREWNKQGPKYSPAGYEQ